MGPSMVGESCLRIGWWAVFFCGRRTSCVRPTKNLSKSIGWMELHWNSNLGRGAGNHACVPTEKEARPSSDE